MSVNQPRLILVTGATGLQGSAVTRQLLADGWRVRALTRSASGEKARALAAAGAELAQGDMDDLASIRPHFEGVYGVFNLQNPVISGADGEIRQGKNVAQAAHECGARHVVYSSAGTGRPGTGVPSWESKLVIEEHMRSLGLPLTVLRPMALMELKTEKKYFPAASTWNIMPRLMGGGRDVGWISAEDAAVVAARVFAAPDIYIGQEIKLASDIKTIDECRAIYQQVFGRKPPRFPMPLWLFKRFGFVGQDLPVMWSWLRDAQVDLDTTATRAIHPQALTVQDWLQKQRL